ncbi:hypothetical protein DIJ64_09850 [Mycobacterium leprae]|uniref:Uncharacterized protein n=1 Tax=Mycobacterium leprae TaxID=1769 RepID=A0AAD0P559_MYCLR|nr:hypothetical protein [Mycobacterium leprae]AWV48245.1 hypothetical protein DIJ64_09850 [Mycobacterium leprae]OAR21014.1 hypothetical protein A8144_07955 [Mycobacterium leprae 3125609]OAX71186.1 hypothetical protein A3216_07180 [Mycobacterium leprae 7935681]
MSQTTSVGQPDPGLQSERTARTSFALLGNGAMMIGKNLHGTDELTKQFPPGWRSSQHHAAT